MWRRLGLLQAAMLGDNWSRMGRSISSVILKASDAGLLDINGIIALLDRGYLMHRAACGWMEQLGYPSWCRPTAPDAPAHGWRQGALCP